MKNPQKITDPFVIKLLKKYRFYKKIVVNDEIDYAKIYDKFKAKEEVLFSFACELLQKFISTQSITEIYKGFEGYTYGLSSSYPVYQVSKLINLIQKKHFLKLEQNDVTEIKLLKLSKILSKNL